MLQAYFITFLRKIHNITLFILDIYYLFHKLGAFYS